MHSIWQWIVNLEDRRNKKLRDPDVLLDYIDSKLIDDFVHYIMNYEIQLVKEFEDVLNSYEYIAKSVLEKRKSQLMTLPKDEI